MDNKEKGISVAEIFKVIFRRVWWVVGVTLAFLLAFVLVVQFWYNRENRVYTITYTIDFPGVEDNIYPDGSQFKYSTIVSEDTLKAIVDSDEELAGIDVEAMTANDDIQLSVTYVSADESISGIEQNNYVLTVSAKYFVDNEQAVAFLRAVAGYPVEQAKQIAAAIDVAAYLSIFDSADSFETMINALVSQREYILSKYDEMIGTLSGEYTFNGSTLTGYRAELEQIFDSADQQKLYDILATEYYVLNAEEFSTNAQAQIAAIEKQIAANQAKIDALIEQRENSNSYYQEAFNTQIANLTTENIELNLQIEDIYKSLAWIESDTHDEDLENFMSLLNGYRSELYEATQTFRIIYADYFENMCDVTYSANKIELEGGMNVVLAAVIGAIVGFVVVSIVICAIDLPAYLRARNSAGEDDSSDDE